MSYRRRPRRSSPQLPYQSYGRYSSGNPSQYASGYVSDSDPDNAARVESHGREEMVYTDERGPSLSLGSMELVGSGVGGRGREVSLELMGSGMMRRNDEDGDGEVEMEDVKPTIQDEEEEEHGNSSIDLDDVKPTFLDEEEGGLRDGSIDLDEVKPTIEDDDEDVELEDFQPTIEDDDEDISQDEFPNQLYDALLPIATGEDEDSDEELSMAAETWLNYNADEIDLIEGLDDKHNQDLGAQLLNAHGLKQSRYDWEKLRSGEVKKWHTKRSWQRDVPDEEVERAAFERDEDWAAWPLEPWRVPREGDRNREEGVAGFWGCMGAGPRGGVEGPETYKPSGDMEEALLAVALGVAKEKWRSRKWTEVDDVVSDEEEDEEAVARELGLRYSSEDLKDEARTDEEGSENPYYVHRAPEINLDHVEEEVERRTWRRTRDRRMPIIIEDDEVAAEKMKPAIRHVLSRLDDLLLALRKTRVAQESRPNTRDGEQSQDSSLTGSVSGRNGSDSEAPTDMESRARNPRSRSRGKGRPKKRRLQEVLGYLPQSSPGYITAKAPGKRGRPRRVPVPLEGENEQEMLIRIAREQHRPAPTFDEEQAPNPKKHAKDGQETRDDSVDEDGDDEGGGDDDDDDEENEELDDGDEEDEEGEEEVPEPSTPLKDSEFVSQDGTRKSGSDSEATIASQYQNWPYPPNPRKRKHSESSSSDDEEDGDFELRYANRDWTAVIGLAATMGFPAKVISRTVARCTALLGENMDLRVFTRLPEQEVETLVQYKPDEIPSDDGLFETSEEESEGGLDHLPERNYEDETDDDDDEMDTSFGSDATSRISPGTHSRTDSKASSQPIIKPENQDSDNELSSSSSTASSTDSEFENVGHRCPLEDCDRHHEGREISSSKALRAHLRKRHEWSEWDIEDMFEESSDEEEMMAGVHRDGFLRKIRPQEYYDRRKNEESGGSEESGESGESEEIEESEESEEEVVVQPSLGREISIEL